MLTQGHREKRDGESFVMAMGWQQTRTTFRHGNLPEALVDAALVRLESDGTEALSLREIARDVGVNHRAVYRHFPDKLSLLACVAEEGWRRLANRMRRQVDGEKPGEDMLVACGWAFFAFAREHPNLFHLMAGPRINTEGRFAALDKAIAEGLQLLMRGFLDAGTDPKVARLRTAVFAAALQGITTQILHRRFRLSPKKAKSELADVCRMLIKGLR
jgi:AcrR family transcriptional regulator